ncbi:MAG: hypothetical protein LC121_26345 [Anaerolineae bacterium]|nr:hypothetical protein [Anaerolineae bacterium]
MQNEAANPVEQDECALTPEQLAFMVQHHDFIEAAYAAENLDILGDLADSAAYRRYFGAMPFEEAYDRYQCMLGA